MSYPRAGHGKKALGACTPTLLSIALASILSPQSQTTNADTLFGAGDDRYTLSTGSPAAGDETAVVSGGSGNDLLVLDGIALGNPARLLHWETLQLDASRLTLDSNLILGDSAGLPGQLQVDADSTLLVPHLSTAVAPSSGQSLTVINHGTIDMRGTTANSLLVYGDFTGSGHIHMDLVAEGDDSLADRLIISGGQARGNTELVFNHLAGSGAETENGILVVETRDGGSTNSNAFYMNGSVSAGPYEYFLFRGADEPEESDNWYLRSTLLPGDVAATAPSENFSTASAFNGNQLSTGDSVAESPTAQLIATAPAAGDAPLRLYRPEIPLYAQAKSLARLTSLQEIGSYHKRRGEQRSWFDGSSKDWVRVHHLRADYNWQGDVSNRFDGSITGFQVGTNFYAAPTCTGGARESGIFLGSTRASGDVSGFARGFSDYAAGSNQLTSHHVGYYFNDYRPNMGYLDITAKVAYLKLESQSSRGIDSTVSGSQLTLSAEKGFTLPASDVFNLEPQLQLIANYSNLSAYNDGISWVEPDMTPELNFRAGLRGYNTDGVLSDLGLRLYLFGNLWHTLGGNDQLLFDAELQLNLEREATWGEFGGGVVLLEHKLGSAFLNLGYQRSLDDLDWSAGSASLGFNWSW
ncbi:autotransporter outer membrane beta-barrel domain-containing protein [uncultured Microbulbifer sp.]|uniref:autotransporter family protein n=1 Tax=uncultured Microbulbifer sp. TaxID=348147 RepID=UPI0025E2C6C4|nr:autotransporter outer membrane beta-barrel domain-containing protein [uncultured Microbulbifer sp.]